MSEANPRAPTNVTSTDLQVASAFYPILVEQAGLRETITYGDLVLAAKARFPASETVQKSIATSAGRKLDVVRLFTNERDLPDLSSIVVNAGTGEVGAAYSEHFDPVERRKAVFEFDWSKADPDFDLHIEKSTAALPKRRAKVPRKDALALMSEYAARHRATLPKGIASERERLLDLIMAGLAVDAAFTEVAAGYARPVETTT